MRTLTLLSIIILSSLALSGCVSGFSERKAPCPPSASLSKNPCNHIPINIALLKEEKAKV